MEYHNFDKQRNLAADFAGSLENISTMRSSGMESEISPPLSMILKVGREDTRWDLVQRWPKVQNVRFGAKKMFLSNLVWFSPVTKFINASSLNDLGCSDPFGLVWFLNRLFQWSDIIRLYFILLCRWTSTSDFILVLATIQRLRLKQVIEIADGLQTSKPGLRFRFNEFIMIWLMWVGVETFLLEMWIGFLFAIILLLIFWIFLFLYLTCSGGLLFHYVFSCFPELFSSFFFGCRYSFFDVSH